MNDVMNQLHAIIDAALAAGQIDIKEYDIIRYNLLKSQYVADGWKY